MHSSPASAVEETYFAAVSRLCGREVEVSFLVMFLRDSLVLQDILEWNIRKLVMPAAIRTKKMDFRTDNGEEVR
jgi:hypothetical protein